MGAILLIDSDKARRRILARRLVSQGHTVEEAGDPSVGAEMALSDPPAAIVADLWMPTISGVQLCRLLRAEPATADVPIILCGADDEPRSRFWAERAGATAYILHGRTGELVRALDTHARREQDDFFVQMAGVDIRDRIARHLDTALFESVIAAELRSLASAGSFERLFDGFAQLMSQLTRYRWVGLATSSNAGLHHHPDQGTTAFSEASSVFGISEGMLLRIEDHDAVAEPKGPPPIVCDVLFGKSVVARFAMAPSVSAELETAANIASIVGRELGGAIKMAELIEQSQRMATTDPLTGLLNRRAFAQAIENERARAARYGHGLSIALFDVDRFKLVNDGRGHAAGDAVLAAVGRLMQDHRRETDIVARWGGEEFIVAFTHTTIAGAQIAAERLRRHVEEMSVSHDGKPIPTTASFGVAQLRANEEVDALIARADAAMYTSKQNGRNRVTVDYEPVASTG